MDLAPPPSVAIEVGYVLGIAAGDVDGDGVGDLVWSEVVQGSNEQRVRYALGPALTPVDLDTGTVYGVAAADVDGDGFDDVLWVSASTCSVHRGGPSGPGEVAWTFPASSVAAIGDVNGDGAADVGVGGTVWFGGPGGPVQGPEISDAGELYAGGDLDGDGVDDLVVSNPLGPYAFGSVEAHLGGPDGPDPTAAWRWSREGGGRDVAAVDVDGDGDVELVMLESTSEHVFASGAVVVLDGVDSVPFVAAEGPRYEAEYAPEPDLAVFGPDADGAFGLAFGWQGVVRELAIAGDVVALTGDTWTGGSDATALEVLGADVDGNGAADLIVAWYAYTGSGAIGVWTVGDPPPPPPDTTTTPPTTPPETDTDTPPVDAPDETPDTPPAADTADGSGCGCAHAPGGFGLALAALAAAGSRRARRRFVSGTRPVPPR